MSKLTSSQAMDLSEQFVDAAERIRQFRRSNQETLTKRDNERLRSTTLSLTMLAQVASSQAVGLALDEATLTLQSLRNATDRAQLAIRRVNDAKKVIQVGTALVSFAASVITRDPRAVIGAIDALADVLKKLEPKKKKKKKKKR